MFKMKFAISKENVKKNSLETRLIDKEDLELSSDRIVDRSLRFVKAMKTGKSVHRRFASRRLCKIGMRHFDRNL